MSRLPSEIHAEIVIVANLNVTYTPERDLINSVIGFFGCRV
jgi:hypothetical protein